MVLKSDKEKVKTLLAETIRLLCKNGLHFKTEFCVEALVGITLDRNEEFFLSIKETVKSDIVSSSDDLQPKPRPDPHRHERLERQEKKVKREPSSYSSCQRKRQSDDVQVQDDNHQAGDLSLGDPQGEQSFWTALTECGNNEQIPKKRRHAEPPDEQSSHSDIRIEIKGEPESDDDIEEIDSPSHDQDQTQTLINMPEQFAFGTAGSSSNPGISGTIPSSALPQQVWDQFPAMGSSDVAGPSGIQSGNTSGLDIDSQQQHPGQQPGSLVKVAQLFYGAYGLNCTTAQPEDVFCTVPSRLSVLSPSKHRVTVAEIHRRLSPPECLNASLLSALLRRAKCKNGITDLRLQLHRLGIEIPNRRKGKITLLTSLVEGEAMWLAQDFIYLCETKFPVSQIAEYISSKPNAQRDMHRHRKILAESKKMVEEFLEVLVQDRSPLGAACPEIILEPHIQQHLTDFSHLSHGFGVFAIIASVRVFYNYLTETMNRITLEDNAS